jgi:uncharacterized repeat protein (TIGR01451 family)
MELISSGLLILNEKQLLFALKITTMKTTTLCAFFLIFYLLASAPILAQHQITQLPYWGAAANLGTSEGQFATPFIQSTVASNYDPNAWTALSINEGGAGGIVTPGAAFWTRSMLGYSQGAYWNMTDPINSPSQANGVAIFDSDFMDNGGVASAFGTGSSPTIHRGELISPRIDLSNSINTSVMLEFYSHYRTFQVTDISVSISIDDGLTWVESVDYNSGLANNFSEEQWQRLNFENALIGVTDASQCRFRFTFDGEYYFVIIDDVTVYTQPNIRGLVFNDFNNDCTADTNELGGGSRLITINPGGITVLTSNNGYWGVDSLPNGSYTATVDTSGLWKSNCVITQAFTVVHPDSIVTVAPIGMTPSYSCSTPDVSIHAPFLRRGFSNQRVYVEACNHISGLDFIDNGYVLVKLDTVFTVDTANVPYLALGNNIFQVDIGDLYPGQCSSFYFSTTISLSTVLNQTLCMSAVLLPLDSCALDSIPNPLIGIISGCNTAYDRSHLEVDATCVNDTVKFTVRNTGLTMNCYTPIRLFIDGVLSVVDSVRLNAGDSTVFCFAGNGRTLRLEASQHPLHAGNSNPTATIERCGDLINWTPDLVNILPHDDADPNVDIYCGIVRGSYDPNDKTGFPLGFGPAHEILPNQKIEYLIRFQNTGTDTAFTVVIRDTISPLLNLQTMTSGVSSNGYTYRIYGPRVVEWTFSNIMLPDSNVNEPASHGFVKFEIEQMLDLPLGTVIENNAGIYFDFNAPIITNTYFHTIEEIDYATVVSVDDPILENVHVNVFPNPFTKQTTFKVEGEVYQELNLSVYNVTGQLVTQQSVKNKDRLELSRGDLLPGVYLYQLLGDDNLVSTGKIIVK